MTTPRRISRALWLGVLLAPFSIAVHFPQPYLLALIPAGFALAEGMTDRAPRGVTLILLPLALVAAGEWPLRHLPADPYGQAAVVISALLGYLAFRTAEGRERLFWLLLLGGAISGLNTRLVGSDPVWLAAYVASGGAVLLVDETVPTGIAWASTGSWIGTAALGALAFLVGGAVIAAGLGVSARAGPGGLSPSPSGGTAAPPVPVGRPISPSTNPVIRIVGTPASAYWQEAIYTSYANGVWNTSSGRTDTIASGEVSLPQMDGEAHPASTTTWRVRVTYLTGVSLPLVYAGRPTLLSVTDGPVLVRVVTGAAEILAPGTRRYDLTLAMPTLDVGALAAAPFPSGATGNDLAVPSSIRSEITHLARSVTKGAKTPWQAAQDIAAYLDTHERYSTSFAAQPQAVAVQNFLFRTHVGDCDQFSTVFVLMMRSLGVPADWVVGFAPGIYNPSAKTETLRAVDEHSWAEVDFGAAGWAPIDPTPGYPFLTLPGMRPLATGRPAPRPATARPAVWPEAVGAVALVLLGIALGAVVRRNRRSEAELWALMVRLAGRRGRAPRGLTPRAVANLCSEGERRDVLPAVDMLEGIWYGGGAVDSAALKEAACRVRAILRGEPVHSAPKAGRL